MIIIMMLRILDGNEKMNRQPSVLFLWGFAAFSPRQLDSFCDLNNLTMGTKINWGNKSPKWTQQKSVENSCKIRIFKQ